MGATHNAGHRGRSAHLPKQYMGTLITYLEERGYVRRDPAIVRRCWSGGCLCMPTEADVAAFAAARRRGGVAAA